MFWLSLNGYKYEKMGYILIKALPEAGGLPMQSLGSPSNRDPNIYTYINISIYTCLHMYICLDLQKSPNKMAQDPKIESIGSIGSIILAILELQV